MVKVLLSVAQFPCFIYVFLCCNFSLANICGHKKVQELQNFNRSKRQFGGERKKNKGTNKSFNCTKYFVVAMY